MTASPTNVAAVAHWRLLQAVYAATVMQVSGHVMEMEPRSHVRVTPASTHAAVALHLMRRQVSPVETAVVVSGHVTLQAYLSPVKETPYSTPVVAVAYWSEHQERDAVIVTMVPLPVVLTASRSTAAATLS
jgi:hypothetical protein